MKQQKFLGRTAGMMILSLLALSGCGGGSGSGTGTLNIGVTDAPVDHAASVVVKFSGVELKPASGNAFSINLDLPKQIDLLNLQGSDFEFLAEDATVPAGNYEWMRLKVITDQTVPHSYITFSVGGTQYPLYVPSGDQSGLKLNNGFTVPEDGVLNLTVDFNLRKSIVDPKNAATAYKLKPVLRLVQDANAGHITGTVPADVYVNDPGCAGAVYLYSGAGATPVDFDSTSTNPQPIASGLVHEVGGVYEYGIGFIEAGSYTVSFTCDADQDNVEQDDSASMTFTGTADVAVNAGETTDHDIVIN